MSRIELWIIFRKYLVAKAPCVVEFSQGEKEKRIVSGVLLIGVAKQYLILLLSFPPSHLSSKNCPLKPTVVV